MAIRPTSEQQEVTDLEWYTDTGGVAHYSTGRYKKHERTWSGSVTPNFHQRKAKGEFIPPLGYASNVIRRNIPMTETLITFLTYPTGTSKTHKFDLVYLGAAEPPLALFGADALAECKNKMLRRLGGNLQGVRANLALMFVERRQTAQLLADSAFRLATAAVSLKQGNLKAFAKALSLGTRDRAAVARSWKKVTTTPVDKRLANHWLEYVFGWLPLLSDMHDAAELLAETVSTYKEPKGSVRAVGRTTVSYSKVDPHVGSGHLYADIDAIASYTCRAKAFYMLDSEARSVLSKTGISNPLSLAWEALPFSFVVDWILPVGNYIDSLTALDGFTFTSATYSTLENAVASWRFGAYNEPGYVWNRTDVTVGGVASATQSRYTRTTSIPSYSFPSLRSPIGSKPLERFTTAVSLLLQVFRGGRRPDYSPRPREFLVNSAWSAPSRRGLG
jgi:hypothetical protein